MKPHVLLLMSCFLSLAGFAQEPRGDRTLAWQIDMAENNNYDSAFVYGLDACMESVHLFFKWTDLEPDTAVYNGSFISNFLDIVDLYYPATGVQVELQIAPTNTGVKEVPSELMNRPFDDPEMIDRFKVMLDTVFARIPNVSLAALNIGNESDINFGSEQSQYTTFKVFLDEVSQHAKDLYFNLHGTELKVGTTFTHHGLVEEATADLCASVNQGLDIVSVTYYPLNSDFTMKPPSAVAGDFEALVARYPNEEQGIYFVECGYASSPLCNSSETQQADFWSEVFTAWDVFQENIHYLTVFKSTDWSQDMVDDLSLYYNLDDPIFMEYLRTLGLRTWEGNGSSKEAYHRVLCELEARDWCDVNCTNIGIHDAISAQAISLFPNPTHGKVRIQGLDPAFTLYELYNAKGQLLRVGSGSVIDMEQLQPGLYLVKLAGETMRIVKR